jgi:intracellular septation protein
MFIKWKPSVINWLFGVAFIGSQFIGKQPFIQRMLGSQLELPKAIWRNLNSAWALFFIALGFINLYVVYNYDTDTWVDFKLFGLMGLTLSFMLLQGLYLARHIKEIPAKPDT